MYQSQRFIHLQKEWANFHLRKVCPLLFGLCFMPLFLLAQTTILERTVTIKMQNAALGDVLKSISQQANFFFSYNSTIIDANKKVTVFAENQSVRGVTRTVLGDNYELKEKGNYLIIRKLKADERLIGGYISDKKTGEKIPNATVYDKKSLKSATTDKYGYYEIVSREPIQELSVARYNYGDTLLQVRSQTATPQYIDVSLLPMTIQEPDPTDDVPEKESLKNDDKDGYTERVLISQATLERWVRQGIRTVERVNDRNIKSNLERTWHFSLLPYVGSNLGLSGNVVNNYSLNATVGYSAGNRKIEVGGLGNINRGDVSGLQIAGLLNVVKKDLRGLQISSIVNKTGMNNGLQVAGITNATNLLRGGQASIINNYATQGRGGIQVAGIVNKVARGKTDVQISGMTNSADTVSVQMGLINSANKVRGFQIGFINVSDTLSGVVLGFINVVKKGYHVLEVSANEGVFANIAYKTGTRKFYTTYIASIRVDSNAFSQQPIWGVGLGLGSSIPLSKVTRSGYKRISLTLDATAQHLSLGQFSTQFNNELYRFAPALNLQLSKKLGIAVAPTFNAYYANLNNEQATATFRSKVLPTWETTQKGKWTTWWGGYVALRFF
ncbi:MAG: hypothetical protein JNL70_05510 [Saprospiraceae bacterium]|nr:hypothetical protein [Saprospiraceae bacterium]